MQDLILKAIERIAAAQEEQVELLRVISMDIAGLRQDLVVVDLTEKREDNANRS